jgi:Tfp pilus assembly protein FimT
MVTLALIALLTTLAVPSFVSLLSNSRLKAATRAVLSQVRYARDLAVRKQTYVRLVIDDVAGTSDVVALVPAGDDQQQSTWESVTEDLGRLRELPEGVAFDRLISSDPDGQPQVTFSPDGRGQEFYVSLADSDDRRLAVRVDGVTGLAEILAADDAAEREYLGEGGGGA